MATPIATPIAIPRPMLSIAAPSPAPTAAPAVTLIAIEKGLALEVGDWHEYWFTISKPEGGGEGTHQLALYLDGALEPAVAEIDFTAGSGSDFDAITYLTIGQGSTGQSGAFDLDFVRVAAGVHAPAPGGVQAPAMSFWGLAITAILIVCGGVFLLRRQPRPGTVRI